MKELPVRITIGASSKDSRIEVAGVDISSLVCRIEIVQDARGECGLAVIKLETIPVDLEVHVDDEVKVLVTEMLRAEAA